MRNLVNFNAISGKSENFHFYVLLLWDPFIQSRKCMNVKFTEVLCVMTVKNDTKFGEESTCRLKIDIRNLTNFDPST